MASLIKRNNGIFYIVSCKKRSGKRVWRSLYTRDKNEAETIFKEQEKRIKAKGVTLLEYYQKIEPMLRLDRVQNTIDFYRYIVKKVISEIGNKKLTSYTTMDFEIYKINRSQNIQKVTINKEIRTLRALFQRAVNLGFLEKNPAKACEFLRVEEKKPKCLTQDQFYTLIDRIEDNSFKNILIFAVMTLMRSGEIAYLEWSDINFNSRQIAVSNKPNHRVKSGKERMVPMNDCIYSMLYQMRQTEGLVFHNSQGGHCKVKALSDRFRRFRRKVGLPEGISFHSLRHTGLTWMSLVGVPSESMCKIAGHSSIKTTHLYVHALPQYLLNDSNKLMPLLNRNAQLDKGEGDLDSISINGQT